MGMSMLRVKGCGSCRAALVGRKNQGTEKGLVGFAKKYQSISIASIDPCMIRYL